MSIVTAAIQPSGTARRVPLLERLLRDEPVLGGLGLFMLALTAPTLFAASVDGRSFQGVGIWLKPLKFQLALAIYFLTLAFYARWLPAGLRARRWYCVFVAAVVVAAVGEIAWIGGAAVLGTASHFNDTLPGALIYPFMGGAAVLITSASAVYALWIARAGALRPWPALREAVVLGLALVLPLTLVTAGTMSALGSHWVGGAPADAGGLPLFGWARDGGDLRVSHFLATHALHFVPAFGAFSAWAFGAGNIWPVRIFAIVFVALVLFTFVQALAGMPFVGWIG